MRIAELARRHGIADEDMRHAIRNAIRYHAEDEFTMMIGAARNGALLEVGILHAESDDPVVIHAMPLRRKLMPDADVE